MKAIRMKNDDDDDGLGEGVGVEMIRNLPSFKNRICPDEKFGACQVSPTIRTPSPAGAA